MKMGPIARRRRRGIAGIIATIIMFAILFTVGTSYFIFVNNLNASYAQNLVGATNKLQGASAESLQVTTTLEPNGDVGFYVNNTSGVVINMTAVYVQSQTGALLKCDGVGQPASASCGNTTPTLWSVVNVGSGSAIFDTGYLYVSGVDEVIVLTARGNTFSQTYPATVANNVNNAASSESVVVNLNQFRWHALNAEPTSIVQKGYTANCNSNQCSLSYGSAVTVADTLLYALGWYGQSPPSTPTDTLGSTFTLGASNSVIHTYSPGLVQERYTSNCNAAACGLAYSSAVSSGDTLVFGLGWANEAAPSAPTDTFNDAFTLGASQSVTYNPPSPSVVQHRYLANCNAATCALAYSSAVTYGNTLVYGLGWPTTTPYNYVPVTITNCQLLSSSLSIDGSATGSFSSTNTGAVTLTTGKTNDIIVVAVNNENTANGVLRTVSGVTSTGLTFHNRSAVTQNSAPYEDTEVWWALASSTLSSASITVTLTGSIDDASIVAFGVNGANTSTPWDTNGAIPAYNSNTASQAPSVSGISTSNAADILFGVNGDSVPGAGAPSTETAGSGYTLIQTQVNSGGTGADEVAAEYQLVSSTQAGVSASFGVANTNWTMIGDAIQAASSSCATPGHFLDGSATGSFSTATSGHVTLSTADSNDIILVYVANEDTTHASVRSVSSVTATGLSFAHRSTSSISSSPYSDGEVWWAYSPLALSSVQITVTLSGSTDDCSIVALGVNGANIVTPWDANVALPKSATATTAGTPSVTGISTSNANDMILGFAGLTTTSDSSFPTETGGAGYSLIQVQKNTGGSGGSEAAVQYKTVTTTQTTVTESFGTATDSSDNWMMTADAIQAAPATATPTTFQELVSWNPSSYSTYEATNLGNVRFCADDACNTPLYAWLESCSSTCSTSGSSSTSANAWVKLTSSIAGNGGTLTVYLVFESTNVNFDDNYWGEAPNLTSTYGQYDNGANVFNSYFNGNTATGSFSLVAGQSYALAQATGVTYGAGTISAIKLTGYGTSETPLVFSTQMTTTGTVVESNFENSKTGTDSGTAGLVDNSAAGSVQNAIGTNNGYNSAYFNQDYVTGGAATTDVNPQGSASTAWQFGSVSYPGTTSTWYSGYVAPQLYSTTNGYSGVVNVNPISAAGHLYLGFLFSTASGSTASMEYNWGRARAYPPNGVMPSTSLGTLVQGTASPTSVTDTLGDTFVVGTSLSVLSGGTTYESYIWYATASSSAADTVTATFASAVAGSISIYEIAGYSTSGILSSTGSSSAGSTASSVSSITPNSNSFVVGNVETGSASTEYTAGGGYATVATGAGGCDASHASQGCNEYATGLGSATTVPFTISASTPWVEVAMSFTPATAVTYYSYMWYATAGSTGSDTISASFGQSVAGSVSIYELSSVTATGLLSETGSSFSNSGSTSVTSMTPSASSVVIGNTESASTGYTVGSGYTLSGTCSSPSVTGCGEYQLGVGSATTVPMTISPISPWVEVALAFAPKTQTYYSYIWYATAAGSGTDSIKATFGSTVVGTVSIYELAGYTTTGMESSTGSSATGSTSASVGSITPPGSGPIMIGSVETFSSSTTYTVGTGYTSVKTGSGGCDGSDASNGCTESLTTATGAQTASFTLSTSETWVESAIALSALVNPQNGQQVGGYPALAVPENIKLEWSESFTNLDPEHRTITVFPTSVLTVGTDEDEFFENTVFFIIQGVNIDGTGLVAYNSSQDFVTLPYDTPVTMYFGSMTPLATTTDLLDEIAGFQATFELSGIYSDHTLFGATIPYPTGYVTNANAATSPQAGATSATISVTCTSPCGFNANAKATIGWMNSVGVITTLKTFTMTSSGNIPAGTTFQVPTAAAGYYTIIVTDYVNSAFMTFQHT